MIRFFEQKDLERLRELENGFEWTFEPDFLYAMAVVDENDRPVMIAGAWKRVETHMVCDHTWESPEKRGEAFLALHKAMEEVLVKEGVAEAITWMDDMKAFGRRLKQLGWDVAKRTMWARRLF